MHWGTLSAGQIDARHISAASRRPYNRRTLFLSPTVSAFLPPATSERPHPLRLTRPPGLFAAADYAQIRAFFDARPELHPTPIVALPSLATELAVRGLVAKDESARFGLNAFKLLGAKFAVETLRADGTLQPGDTIICASEGNHGRAVARAAHDAGCRSRVYLAQDVAQSRADAIANEGADVVRIDGSYDDAVRLLQRDADAHGWTIVSDTAWPGYERIPFLIMLGYTRMLDEAFHALDADGRSPRALFVQGGVGGLLCAMASWCAFHRPECQVISVEPTQAACLQASARAGHPVAVEGPLETTLAGLRNREVSPLAFEASLPHVAAFMAIDDRWAFDAMRALDANGIRAGASGAAATGGLLALCRDEAMRPAREALALDDQSTALCIVSEGVTDPALFDAVTSARDQKESHR